MYVIVLAEILSFRRRFASNHGTHRGHRRLAIGMDLQLFNQRLHLRHVARLGGIDHAPDIRVGILEFLLDDFGMLWASARDTSRKGLRLCKNSPYSIVRQECFNGGRCPTLLTGICHGVNGNVVSLLIFGPSDIETPKHPRRQEEEGWFRC